MLALIARSLQWIGSFGIKAVAVSCILGLLLPELASVIRPLLWLLVLLLITLSYIRVSKGEVLHILQTPALSILYLIWTMLLFPLVALLLVGNFAPDALMPSLLLVGLMLCAAPPTNSSTVIAYLMGLSAPLAITVVSLCMLVTPLTVPFYAYIMIGDTPEGLTPVALFLRLFSLLFGAIILAALGRKFIGSERIDSHRQHLDGINVILLFLFAIAAMDGVRDGFFTTPYKMFLIVGVCFSLSLLQMTLGYLLFRKAGVVQAATLAICSANRNPGLIIAALGGAAPELVWLFFAMAQFPIYFMPLFSDRLIAFLVRDRK